MTADPEIEKLLETGNMEQLAALVLSGEGRRLVGRHSGNPELQAFIDRVPSYMVLRTKALVFCLVSRLSTQTELCEKSFVENVNDDKLVLIGLPVDSLIGNASSTRRSESV